MFTIGKLAGLTSVSNDTLRYYEQERLISPTAKSAAGYRLYDQESARRIHFIKHAHDHRRAGTSEPLETGVVTHEG